MVNAVLGLVVEGASALIMSDFQSAVHNYLYGNCEGLWIGDTFNVEMDHVIITANLRGCPSHVGQPKLFFTDGNSDLTLRNAPICDNDSIANPGVQQPCSASGTCPGPNNPGTIFHHNSMGKVEVVASTVIDNQMDLVVSWPNVASAGTVMLHQTYFANNWGKVLSATVFSPSSSGMCPPLVVEGSVVHGNFMVYGGYGSSSNCPRPFINGDLQANSTSVPTSMFVNYPHLEPVKYDIYKLNVVFEPPSSLPLPAGLFTVFDWSVDTKHADELAPTDVGYHNPM